MTTFHNTGSIGQKGRISFLEDNLKSFLDWSFLHIGGFVNVDTNGDDLYENDLRKLLPVSDPSQRANIWESSRKDWVYETSASYSGTAPVDISGVYVNSTFLSAPTGSGNYGYNINYPLGRIEFSTNLSTTSKIYIDYSYRYIQVYKANTSDWWLELQRNTYAKFPRTTSGDLDITANHRAQMPFVIVETIGSNLLSPFQIGDSRNILNQDILLHIFSDNINHRNNIAETLLQQKDNSFRLYDTNRVVEAKKYPLNRNGSKNDQGMTYPELVDNYAANWCSVKNSNISELNTFGHNLFNAIVRWNIEIYP